MTEYEQWNLIITGAGVVLGFGVLVVYALQLKAMRQVVATAIQSEEGNKTRFAADTRAWIGVETVRNPAGDGIDFVRLGEPVIFKAVVRNLGNTPASRVRTGCHFRILDKDERFEPKRIAVPGQVYPPSSGVVMPNVVFFISSHPAVLPAEISVDKLRDGSLILYLFIEVKYVTLGIEAETTYCGILLTNLRDIRTYDAYNEAT